MSLLITIDVFSGRPNPVVEVSGKQEKEVLEHLKPKGVVSKREVASLVRPHLGYRGLIVEQIGVRTRNLPRTFRVVGGTIIGPEEANRTADEECEDFLFSRRGPLGKVKVATGFDKFLAREIARFHRAEIRRPHKIHKPPRCRCAPDYEPAWWNDGGQKQFNNNCYNYSANYRTDTFAQPGRAAGAMYTTLTCAFRPHPYGTSESPS